VPQTVDLRDLKSPEEASKHLRTARQTLAKWRCAKIGPPYVRIGGRIYYLRADLDAFIAGGRVADMADAS
jgi:hypothetical protein